MKSTTDILTYEEVKDYLNTKFFGRKIYYYKTIDSTNKIAKKIAFKEKEGTIVIAEEQTQGRGRMGRTWISPKKTGIYFSLILKPKIPQMEVGKLTLIGAAAVHLALKEIGINSQIKWPNDIVINGKKACGILTEMTSDVNMNNHIIIGIGINVNLDKNEIPENLKHKATSLKIESNFKVNRKKLFAEVLNKFEEMYVHFIENDKICNAIEINKKNSALIGKEVSIINGKSIRRGKAIDINEAGELIVEFKDGKIEKVFSGEISIRGIEGYI